MTATQPFYGMTEAERLLGRLQAMHRERVELIRLGKAETSLKDLGCLIVHFMPEETFAKPAEFSAATLKRSSQSMRPLGIGHGSGGDWRSLNYDDKGKWGQHH